MEEKKYSPPTWLVVLIAISLGIIIFFLTLPRPNTVTKEAEKKSIQKSIDSTTGVKNKTITEALVNSKKQVEKADLIIKKLPHEKPIIRDTTYNAMCKYITNYRPSATIEAE